MAALRLCSSALLGAAAACVSGDVDMAQTVRDYGRFNKPL
jgi:hypothetical protein